MWLLVSVMVGRKVVVGAGRLARCLSSGSGMLSLFNGGVLTRLRRVGRRERPTGQCGRTRLEQGARGRLGRFVRGLRSRLGEAVPSRCSHPRS